MKFERFWNRYFFSIFQTPFLHFQRTIFSQKPNKSIKALSYLGLTFLIFLVVTSSRKRYFSLNLCHSFPASFCCWCLTVLIVNEKGSSPNRSSRRRCSLKISQNLLKKRLWQGCFPVKFVKILRTPLYRISGLILSKFCL